MHRATGTELAPERFSVADSQFAAVENKGVSSEACEALILPTSH